MIRLCDLCPCQTLRHTRLRPQARRVAGARQRAQDREVRQRGQRDAGARRLGGRRQRRRAARLRPQRQQQRRVLPGGRARLRLRRQTANAASVKPDVALQARAGPTSSSVRGRSTAHGCNCTGRGRQLCCIRGHMPCSPCAPSVWYPSDTPRRVLTIDAHQEVSPPVDVLSSARCMWLEKPNIQSPVSLRIDPYKDARRAQAARMHMPRPCPRQGVLSLSAASGTTGTRRAEQGQA